MRAAKGVAIVEPWPAVKVEPLDAVVFADLHIGIEEELAEKGIQVPIRTFEDVSEAVAGAVEASKASRAVILGDIKHVFGETTYIEWVDVRKLLQSLLDMGLELVAVRGNHDTFIRPILRKLGIPLHEELSEEGYLLVHGHRVPLSLGDDVEVVVIGHEHPAVKLRDTLGAVHKFRCFLSGEWQGRELVVLPSVNPLATGVAINEVGRDDLLSPILRSCELDSFVPFLIEPGEAVKKFPALGLLERLLGPEERY